MSSWIRVGSVFVVLAAIVVGLSTTACEEVTKAASIKVPITISVNPESINPTIPQTDIDCYDLTENKDYNDNADKITEGELKSAAFQIIQLDNPSFATSSAVFSTISFELKFHEDYEDPKMYQLGTFNNIALIALYRTLSICPFLSRIAKFESTFATSSAIRP